MKKLTSRGRRHRRWPFSLARPEAVDYPDELFPGTFTTLEQILVLPWNERFTTEHVDHLAEGLTRNFWWDDLEPRPGRFDWDPADALMAEAARARVEILPILDDSAAWASSAPPGHPDPLSYPPTDPADYARFAGAVVGRYEPGGGFWSERPDLVPMPVRAVELWNEPWLDTFWRPRSDPAAYAELAVRGARAVHDADPHVDVLIDGSARDDMVGDAPWIRQVLTARPALVHLVDAYAVHPYTGLRELDRTREETVALDAEKPLWITEIGSSTATDRSGALLEGAVAEATQADLLAREVGQALSHSGVARVYVYTDTCDEPLPAEDYFGLCRADGTRKPAWDALIAVSNENNEGRLTARGVLLVRTSGAGVPNASPALAGLPRRSASAGQGWASVQVLASLAGSRGGLQGRSGIRQSVAEIGRRERLARRQAPHALSSFELKSGSRAGPR